MARVFDEELDLSQDTSRDPAAVFADYVVADYVVAHVSEDDIPGLLEVMKGLTAEQMVGALEAHGSGH